MSKTLFTFIILVVLAGLGGAYYWFFVRMPNLTVQTDTSLTTNNTFSPFSSGGGMVNGGTGNSNNGGQSQNGGTSTDNQIDPSSSQVPSLRHLSTTPIGGMAASTTASSTIVRWIDRGVGHIFQAYSDNLAITELSNTTIPRVYESYWSGKANALIFSTVPDDSDTITTFYAEIKASASASNTTPYELKGSTVPSNTTAVALSPKGDSVFTLTNENAAGVGYTSLLNGQKRTQIFTSPLTQFNIDWPEINTLALTTKGTSFGTGFLYFVNPKNGVFNKILGNIRGLSTLTSHDAKKVLYSSSANNTITTAIFDVKTHTSQSLAFNTLPDKCVWGTINKDILFCAVPSEIPAGAYPEAWYNGTVSFSDKIWQVNAATGDVHIVADLLGISRTIIDAENLKLDPKENYIYFMNKRDLTLWSFSLNG
jgi:hypothetical protein